MNDALTMKQPIVCAEKSHSLMVWMVSKSGKLELSNAKSMPPFRATQLNYAIILLHCKQYPILIRSTIERTNYYASELFSSFPWWRCTWKINEQCTLGDATKTLNNIQKLLLKSFHSTKKKTQKKRMSLLNDNGLIKWFYEHALNQVLLGTHSMQCRSIQLFIRLPLLLRALLLLLNVKLYPLHFGWTLYHLSFPFYFLRSLI